MIALKVIMTMNQNFIRSLLLVVLFLLPVTLFATDLPASIDRNNSAASDNKGSRPDADKGPTDVTYRIFVLDINEINGANQTFTANLYLALSWNDPRLVVPAVEERLLPLSDVWNPQLIIANQYEKMSESLPDVVRVFSDGTVMYRQRYTGRLSQRLTLTDFPFDRHVFRIHFGSAAYGEKDIRFIPGASQFDSSVIGASMAEEMSLPDWEIINYSAYSQIYNPVPAVRTAAFVFEFEARRYFVYYLLQIIFPLTVVMVMSWLGFWVQRDQVGVRIAMATSSVLTLIAHRFVVANLLPKLPYMTLIDYFSVGGALVVFISLIGIVTTAYLVSINREATARKVDLAARVFFPVSFIVLVVWFIVGRV
jgi:hypothetical protein